MRVAGCRAWNGIMNAVQFSEAKKVRRGPWILPNGFLPGLLPPEFQFEAASGRIESAAPENCPDRCRSGTRCPHRNPAMLTKPDFAGADLPERTGSFAESALADSTS